MITTIIISLVISAVSGLTFIAYKHPDGYKKMCMALSSMISIVVVFLLSYNLGSLYVSIRTLHKSLTDYPHGKLKDFDYSVVSMNKNIDDILLTLSIGVLILGYLFFLHRLPSILGIGNKKNSTKT